MGPFLHYTLDFRSESNPANGELRLTMIRLLLRYGARIDELFQRRNAWQITLACAFDEIQLEPPTPNSQCLCLGILDLLLDHGANPDVQIPGSIPSHAMSYEGGYSLQL